ncbi:hypothetical protein AAFF_G00201500 [Aldrovandia affinis]|uniref:Uncharacterized protein n=1 Tax=Aldrovandia affinis TaxID=143900 RepID=A0AAD7SWP4_9TELE|nr:hypothetical protein AAFF_G00201500 [Aldrovandia affinis]
MSIGDHALAMKNVTWTGSAVETLLRWLRDPGVNAWLDLEEGGNQSLDEGQMLLSFMKEDEATQRKA